MFFCRKISRNQVQGIVQKKKACKRKKSKNCWHLISSL